MNIELPVRPNHPWLSIWIRPRSTMRAILDYDPNYLVTPLIIVSGIARGLDQAISREAGSSFGTGYIVFFILVAAPLAAMLGLQIVAAILTWLGRLLGGTGAFDEVRSAVAWATVPQALVLVAGLLMVAIMGAEAFTTETPQFDARLITDPESLLLALISILALAGAILAAVVATLWSTFLSIKCLAEAHKFSAWRSIATLLVPTFVVIVFALVAFTAVSA